ncbi:hypothetical protein GGX14DRAFT_354603 [Mycena pura]|uniref:Polysaccharide lyase 14 domain-containing protein n=1 Tax=Mycena pura TaxID=153505 RepID=A0AAD6VUH0_9AGAR|nr:hypothetical protein GGX14DRAFT_354603 [Mycena pura]
MTPSPNRRTAKSLGRRSCKPPPSNSNSTALPTGSAVLVAPSASKEQASASSTATEHTAATKSKTSTSAKATSTSGSGSSSGGGGALSLDALFPMGTPGKSWTTSPKDESALPLSDGTLNPTSIITALTHTYMAAPDGKYAMRAIYPEGSWTPSNNPRGGISFYAPGSDDLDMTTAKELTFGYSVFFEKGFQFNKGGKLPGIYGGDDAETAISCSGGRRATNCYSARLMWRTDGAGELYTYLPDSAVKGFAANKAVCDIPPLSECNPTYGASVGRGSFKFPTGEWITVAQRVRLNDVGQANGEIELWANGQSVVSAKGLILRDSDAGRHRGIQMQTFFGGSTSDWASPQTQDTYFSDFSVAITEPL